MNEEKIIDMYCKQKCSTYEIAQHFNTYPNKIRRLLVKRGVKMNDKSKAQQNALKKGRATIPTKGTNRSKEERLKISSSLKKRWDSIDPEKYEEHVNKARERWYNMSEAEKKEMNQAAAKAIQKAAKEGSKLEKFLKYELTKEGYIIETHKKDLLINDNLEIDMYFPQLKAIIEIDGPSHFLPIWGEKKLQQQIKADQHKTGLILSKGFAIIRVKNLSDSMALSVQEDLKNQLVQLLESIKKKFPTKSKRYIEIEI